MNKKTWVGFSLATMGLFTSVYVAAHDEFQKELGTQLETQEDSAPEPQRMNLQKNKDGFTFVAMAFEPGGVQDILQQMTTFAYGAGSSVSAEQFCTFFKALQATYAKQKSGAWDRQLSTFKNAYDLFLGPTQPYCEKAGLGVLDHLEVSGQPGKGMREVKVFFKCDKSRKLSFSAKFPEGKRQYTINGVPAEGRPGLCVVSRHVGQSGATANEFIADLKAYPTVEPKLDFGKLKDRSPKSSNYELLDAGAKNIINTFAPKSQNYVVSMRGPNSVGSISVKDHGDPSPIKPDAEVEGAVYIRDIDRKGGAAVFKLKGDVNIPIMGKYNFEAVRGYSTGK